MHKKIIMVNDSPGDKLGLRPGNIPVQIGQEKRFIGGDIVLAVQDKPISLDIRETCKIGDTMGGLKQGERIVFKVLRGGNIVNLYTSK